MDRGILLKSLPFLYEVTPSERFLIWNQHWETLSQQHQGKEDLSSELLLFPCHSLSIETVNCGTDSTGVAFFSNVKRKLDSWNNTESSSSSSTTVETVDPALSKFKAYLLPVQRQISNENRDDERTNFHEKRGKEYTSPAASSSSTAMTKSQSPKTPTHAGSRSGKEESCLLYFVIDQDVLCVDHRQIRSICIEEAITRDTTNRESHQRDLKSSVSLPMSLLFTFDSVVFRVFHDNFDSDGGGLSVSEQESVLRKNFLKIKTFMLSDIHCTPEYGESNHSFLSYLDHLSALHHLNGDHFQSSSPDENGQTSNDAMVARNGNENTDCMNLNSMDDTDRAERNATGAAVHPLVENLKSYEKSWQSLKSIHSLLKLRRNGKITNDLDQQNVFFGSLCNQTAIECTKSYISSEQHLLLQESKAEIDLAEIEEAINRNVNKIFPVKGQCELQRSEDIDCLQTQIEKQLSDYKKMVNSKHRALSFIPRR